MMYFQSKTDYFCSRKLQETDADGVVKASSVGALVGLQSDEIKQVLNH